MPRLMTAALELYGKDNAISQSHPTMEIGQVDSTRLPRRDVEVVVADHLEANVHLANLGEGLGEVCVLGRESEVANEDLLNSKKK